MDLTQILPQFGNLAFTLFAFVVALSIIVAVHEFGHYIVGRWSGIHAEVFSLGFGPVLVSRQDRRGTRWQIAALPFGGYVKFLGDANAASVGGDMEHVAPRDRRHTMMGAPLWARTATVIAGPAFNFLLSIVIFAGVILLTGQPRLPLTVATVDPLPGIYGDTLRPGDEILAIAGTDLTGEGLYALTSDAIPVAAQVDYSIRRDGEVLTVSGPNPDLPVVGALNPGSAAYAAGIEQGDVVLAVAGQEVVDFQQIVAIVSGSDGQPLDFRIWRGGEELLFTLTPTRQDLPLDGGGFETRWLVGIVAGDFLDFATESPGPLAALGDALGQVWYIITQSISSLWHIATGGISTCNLSGPVGIAQASGAMASQGTASFIWFVAVLSTAVGLLNLFPVPMLDGGHLVFYAYEAVAGRAPGDRALRVLMVAGLAVILSLTLFGVMNDLFLCP